MSTTDAAYPLRRPAHDAVVDLIRHEHAERTGHLGALVAADAAERIGALLDALYVIDRQRYHVVPGFTARMVMDSWCDHPDPLRGFSVHFDLHTDHAQTERVAQLNRTNAENCRAELLAELHVPDPRPSIHDIVEAEIVEDEDEEYDHSRAKEDLRNGLGR